MNSKLIYFIFVAALWLLVIVLFVLFLFNNSKFNFLNLAVIKNFAESSTKQEQRPVNILAFGDMMLDRKVREKIIENGPEYPFLPIKDFLKGENGIANDIVVANAEGPFTNRPSVTVGIKNAPLNFTFDPAVLPTLKDLGFTLLDQANNHSLNFGLSGFNESTTSIKNAGLDWFGDPRNIKTAPYIKEIGREKIAFIGYNEFSYQGVDNIMQQIKDAKSEASFVIVYAHWGNEYESVPSRSQQSLAHKFIDAGADAVIGMHPHVIQPVEKFNNKIIFYSLGNFIFDQANGGPTTRGLAVKITLTRDLVTYDLFPISILKQQASLLTGEEKQKELDQVEVPTGEIKIERENIAEKLQEQNKIFKKIKIGQLIITAELADTEAAQIKGLSGRTSLAPNTGMFFIFDHLANWGIWMKEMNFPIDVLWLDENMKVTDIVENMSPASYPKIYSSHVPTKYVLEIPAGVVTNNKIKIGQKVTFE